jgi:DNA-binding NarL/FixJ family response regulator
VASLGPSKESELASVQDEFASSSARILIVDDSPLVRQRLRDMLQQHPHWKVCGEAASGTEAIQKVQGLGPDLIVLDFLMPGMDGLQAARELGKVVPDVPILMFTMHLSRQLVEEARNAGIRGAVAKSDAGRIIEGVEALLRNEAFFCALN